MKKILLIALFAFGMNANAQITLEQRYSVNPVFGHDFSLVNFTSAGFKYAQVNPDSGFIRLFNLNHSLYKTIIVPPQPKPQYGFLVFYLSDELFNTDSSDIEYVLENRDSSNNEQITIYDEFGNTLFKKTYINWQVGWEFGLYTGPIRYTSSGIKLILFSAFDSSSYVYSLPGILPCHDCTGGIVSGLAPNGGSSSYYFGVQKPYPNPTNSTMRIDYTLPKGVNQGEIVFYDLQGKEIKRFKVNSVFDHLLISTSDVSAGTYYYQLQTASQNSEGKKIVVVK
ncbi:MAG: T9SS type A sorting domain-containing protein [Bacteroidetes bacterium]|nr:T9SS type A sorting domain-containing protein [Bacteroidota bacterium]